MRKAKYFVVTDVNYGFVHHVQMLQMHATNFYLAKMQKTLPGTAKPVNYQPLLKTKVLKISARST